MSRTKQTLAIEDLAPAPYNPRSITPEALHGLSASIQAYGDVSGVTWNRHTGHLIAGHQRVRVLRERGATVEMDAAGPFIRDPQTGEAFRVRVVDWDESKEKAANITANNLAISGLFTSELRVVLDEIRVEMPADLFADLRLDGTLEALPELTERVKGKTDPDDVPEPLPAPVSRRGDVWVCGGTAKCPKCGRMTDV